MKLSCDCALGLWVASRGLGSVVARRPLSRHKHRPISGRCLDPNSCSQGCAPAARAPRSFLRPLRGGTCSTCTAKLAATKGAESAVWGRLPRRQCNIGNPCWVPTCCAERCCTNNTHSVFVFQMAAWSGTGRERLELRKMPSALTKRHRGPRGRVVSCWEPERQEEGCAVDRSDQQPLDKMAGT
ncbi:hypothetical protein NDU88_002245 [Pleurodeles waltl]|uniref:Secreted protein n=1 Tax=Pleurodeles waltl TaxID=8319 RepID=A0AAV7VCP1_PLEWA|nr:hypothetical protein NDU88_002245 [Pleurodeles waltl]